MAKPNVWLSVSDLMTGLMVIFLFVAIAYINRVQENQTSLTEYIEIKTKTRDKLVNEFAGDTLEWQMSIGRDLTMKFKEPTVLFQMGSYQLTKDFKGILDKFLPRYFNILLEDSIAKNIKEIRIEGHTDTIPIPSYDPDPYIANAMLSQQRALSVIRYFRTMHAYKQYTPEQQSQLEFWLTANGLSYGKALDSNGEYAHKSGKPIDNDLSRRVEFRIVTIGEEVLEKFVIANEKQ